MGWQKNQQEEGKLKLKVYNKMFISNGIEIGRTHYNWPGVSMKQVECYLSEFKDPNLEVVEILDTDERGNPDTFLTINHMPYLKKR